VDCVVLVFDVENVPLLLISKMPESWLSNPDAKRMSPSAISYAL
jgi:hypothetical protein